MDFPILLDYRREEEHYVCAASADAAVCLQKVWMWSGAFLLRHDVSVPVNVKWGRSVTKHGFLLIFSIDFLL